MKRLMAALVMLLSGVVPGAQSQTPKEFSFPNTKKYGRATAEYRQDGFHFVINYDYSQRQHSTRWLLVDLGAASSRRYVLHKKDVRLLTPDGGELPLAPHQAFIDDTPALEVLLQNAQIFRRPVDSYFNQGSARESIRFQVLPGRGTISEEAIVDNDRVAIGALFFRTPAPRWEPGTYRLAIDHQFGAAALPIALE